MEEVERNPDLVYTDKAGRRNPEYLSLGCDTLPVLKGRSPVQVYTDFMRSFRDTFANLLGDVIIVSFLILLCCCKEFPLISDFVSHFICLYVCMYVLHLVISILLSSPCFCGLLVLAGC